MNTCRNDQESVNTKTAVSIYQRPVVSWDDQYFDICCVQHTICNNSVKSLQFLQAPINIPSWNFQHVHMYTST